MLYLFDDYLSENPNKYSPIFLKFQDSPKNLHEMTVDEINETLKDEEYSINTIQNYRNALKLYLEWLQAHGVKCDADIYDSIKFNESKVEYLIFSADDIHKQYEILFDYVKKLYGARFSPTTYYLPYAAGILAFYGVSPEKIINLDYYAISKDGVKGYDLPLTKKDIDVLIFYQTYKGKSDQLGFGDKYIRSGDSKLVIKPEFLSRPLWNIKFDDEHAYLKQTLGVANLYKLGRLARMYEQEVVSSTKIELCCKTPQWFLDEFSEYNSISGITNIKKAYIAYRAEREIACKVQCNSKKPISTPALNSFGGGGGGNKVACAPNQLGEIERELRDCINTMQNLAPRLARLAELVAELNEQELIKF